MFALVGVVSKVEEEEYQGFEIAGCMSVLWFLLRGSGGGEVEFSSVE